MYEEPVVRVCEFLRGLVGDFGEDDGGEGGRGGGGCAGGGMFSENGGFVGDADAGDVVSIENTHECGMLRGWDGILEDRAGGFRGGGHDYSRAACWLFMKP